MPISDYNPDAPQAFTSAPAGRERSMLDENVPTKPPGMTAEIAAHLGSTLGILRENADRMNTLAGHLGVARPREDNPAHGDESVSHGGMMGALRELAEDIRAIAKDQARTIDDLHQL